jgi:hypothetical protein
MDKDPRFADDTIYQADMDVLIKNLERTEQWYDKAYTTSPNMLDEQVLMHDHEQEVGELYVEAADVLRDAEMRESGALNFDEAGWDYANW